MKIRIKLLFLALAISVTSNAQTLNIHTNDGGIAGFNLSEIDSITYSGILDPPFPLVGLIAFYPFNGNADDESGNSNDGSIHGASLTEDRFGAFNSAYEFDGVDDFIGLGNNSTFSPDHITVAAWFNSTSQELGSPFSQVIIRNRLFGYNIVINPYVEQETEHIGGISCGIRVGNGNDLYRFISPDTTYNEGDWHFVAATYDGSMFSFYINGELVYQDNSHDPGPIYYETGGVAIGRDGDNSANYFDGKIDDLRIYNRALSWNEILLLFEE